MVRSARKLRRTQWRLTRKGVLVVRKLPSSGVSSLTARLSKGVLKSGRALRKAARAGKHPRLRFKLRVTDVKQHRFNFTRTVRPRK